MSNNQLKYIVLAGLFVIPFVPLIVSTSLFFPFITGKAFAFRVIVEIIFAVWLVLAIRDINYRPKFSWILGALISFLVIIGLADIFAVNPHKAFWSNFERMEGCITLLHLGALFLVMGSVLKTQKLWNGLLTTSVGSSAIMAVYSFFQIVGKITINQGGVRVDGTLGNASYLGIYMALHVFFAVLLLLRSKKIWVKILLGAVGLADLIVLYYTATRGAILGLLGGALVSLLFLAFKPKQEDLSIEEQSANNRIKKIAIGGLVAIIVFVGLFAVLRNNSFVKNNPVLSRFASLSFSEIKTQGRYFVWPMAVKGFLENPVLGWGQEGFNFVFNKYYDPRMYNQEPWFDRAHNTYLDWLIAGGALGLLSYLAIISALIFYIFKSKEDVFDRKDKAVILGAVSAYMFHNLFVFDQISSYILFFTILAYVHSHAPETKCLWWDKIASKLVRIFESEKNKPIFEAVILIILIAVLYFVNFLPWQYNKKLLDVLRLGNEGKVGTVEEYTKPLSKSGMWYSESLEHISQAAIGLLSNQNASTEIKKGLFDNLDKSFSEYIKDNPKDTRYELFYGIFLARYGLYTRALVEIEKAIELSPKKQQIYFEYVSDLLLSGKNKEAAEAAQKAYQLDTSYEEAKYIYGLALIASGDQSAGQQIISQISENKVVLDDRYIGVLLGLEQYDNIIQVIKRRIEIEPGNLQHRITLTAAYLKANRRQEAIQTLEELIKLEPSFKEQGEHFINEIRAGRNP